MSKILVSFVAPTQARAGQIIMTTAAADHGSLLGQCACTLWAGGRAASDHKRHRHAKPPGTPHAHAPRYWIKTSFCRRRQNCQGVGSPCTSNDSPASHDRSARAIRSRKCFSPSLFAALVSSVIDPFLKDGDSFLHGDNTIEASCDALTVPLDHDDRSGHRHPYCSGHLYAF